MRKVVNDYLVNNYQKSGMYKSFLLPAKNDQNPSGKWNFLKVKFDVVLVPKQLKGKLCLLYVDT